MMPKNKEKRGYWLPKSWSWRLGALMITTGISKIFMDSFEPLEVFGDVLGGIYGSTGDPVDLILMGGALIGVRAKLERLAEDRI